MTPAKRLQAPSAQSLCIFCACRLGIESAAATSSQLQRRRIATTRPLFQSATATAAATASAPENGAVEGSSSRKGGLPAWYDATSSLSMSEQRERENRRQVRAQVEMERTQAAQEAIWREDEQKNRLKAEAQARKKAEQEASGSRLDRSGVRNGGSFRKVNLNVQQVGSASGTPQEQGTSLKDAMRPKEPVQRRQSQNGAGNAVGKEAANDGKLVFRKNGQPLGAPKDIRPKLETARSATPREAAKQPRAQPQQQQQQQQQKPPKISNPFASGRQSNGSESAAATGWGAAPTETKPLEYSDAPPPQPKRFGVSDPTGATLTPNPNIEDVQGAPRIVRFQVDSKPLRPDRAAQKSRDSQQHEPTDADLQDQQSIYDRAAKSFARRRAEEPQPTSERGLGDSLISPQYTTTEHDDMRRPRDSDDGYDPRTNLTNQPQKSSGHQASPGLLANDTVSLSYRNGPPATNVGSFGHFDKDYEPANLARPQPPPSQPQEAASASDQWNRAPAQPTPAATLGSFGSFEVDSQYQEDKLDRQAAPLQRQESARSPLADLSIRSASNPTGGAAERRLVLDRDQPPPSTKSEAGWGVQQTRAQQPTRAPQEAQAGSGTSQQHQQQPTPSSPAPTESSKITLGQQYGHLPGCPCNLCNLEPSPASRFEKSSLPPSRDRAMSDRQQHQSQPATQRSRHDAIGSSQIFDPPASRGRLGDTGYRSIPFDPNEFQNPSSQSREDNPNDWQHLRRRNSESTRPASTNSPSQAQQQYQPARNKFLDDDWVDRTFENHRRERAMRQQQQIQPSQQTRSPIEDRDARYSRQMFDEDSVRNKKCGRCGEIGHVARQCTKPNRMKCLECGEIGHAMRDCPQRKAASSGPARSVFGDPKGGWETRNARQAFDKPAYDRRHSAGSADGRVQNPFDDSRSSSGDQRRVQKPWSQQPDSRGRDDGRERHADRFGGRNDRPAERTAFARDEARGDPQTVRRVQWQEEKPETEVEKISREKESREKLARRSRWDDADVEESDRGSGRGRKAQRGGRREFDEEEDEEEGARDAFRARKAARQATKEAEKEKDRKIAKREREARKAENATPITLPEFTSVQHLSQLLGVRYEHFVERLEELGYDDIFPGKTLNSETAGMIAMEYNFEPTFDAGIREGEERDLKPQPEAFDKELLATRPPVVTIMGHVDHGKTTILDYLRNSSVAAGEAGGITQHIGAFSVPLASSGRTITFLDTPGHAAFLAMRQRGANVTDIVILVVAADDSVKPQTLEAIKHAKAAGVPMVVAINKVDKEEADVQRVKQDLARHGVEIEDFGGETQVVEVSGKTGRGMDELEETVVTLSEILDHRAETEGGVEGWVLEATTKASGRVATVLVRRGTLKIGDVVVAGRTWARVRTLKNETGRLLHEIGPGMPVEVDGWRDQPMAGDEVLEAPTEQKATGVVEYRIEMHERQRTASDTEAINETRRIAQERQAREKALAAAAKQAQRAANADGGAAASPDADSATSQEEQSGQMVVPFIIKADVSGSVEAVSAYIMSVSNPLIAPSILHSGVGAIHESDIELADAAKGHIIAFNLPTDPEMNGAAEARGIKLLENNIIYRVLDDVKGVLEEKLPPIISQRVLGEAEIGASFEISVGGRKKLKIAGCKVRNGVVGIRGRVRVLRGGERIYDGTISSLKNVKKDVQEMRKGTDCGMGFEGWEGFEVGDQVQTYEEVSERRKL